jgi:hypothetical protein
MYIKPLLEISDKALWKKVDSVKELFRLARKYKLSEYMIEEISEHIKLTNREEGWKNYKHILNEWWRNVAWFQPMSEEFIVSKINALGWSNISCNSYLTENFIHQNHKMLRWQYVCRFVPLSEQMIEQYAQSVNWNEIWTRQKLSEQFILKFQEKINWTFLMQNRYLAKDFFERNKELITVKLYATDMVKIIEGQTLSEETIKQIKKGKMAWGAISENSNLSKEFVLDNYKHINPRKVMRNRKIDREVRDEVEMIERLSGGL